MVHNITKILNLIHYSRLLGTILKYKIINELRKLTKNDGPSYVSGTS